MLQCVAAWMKSFFVAVCCSEKGVQRDSFWYDDSEEEGLYVCVCACVYLLKCVASVAV